MIKELMKSIREYKRDSILTPILVSLEVVMECIIPFVVAQLVNEIKAGSGMGVISRYGLILVVMALMSLIRSRSRFGLRVRVLRIRQNLRKDMFYRIQDFSFENIDKFSTSSLVTRMTTDVERPAGIYDADPTCDPQPADVDLSFTMAFIMGGKMALIFLVVIRFWGSDCLP
ncbi:MAG: ABC transporter transmembrane domain-containing protein [Gallintestinimicrobium sp.]